MHGLTIGIVYSHEPVSQLQRCLSSLEKQVPLIASMVSTVELVIVCTPRALQKDLSFFPGRILRSTTENLGINRALALDSAKTDAFYFTDPDCWQDDQSLYLLCEKMLSLKNDTSVYAVAGPNIMTSKNPFLESFFQWMGHLRWLNGGLSQIAVAGKDRWDWHSPTCHILYFKPHLQQLNFSSRFDRVGEDLEMHFRLKLQGKKVFICRESKVWHEQPATLASYLKKVFFYGTAQTVLLKTHPASFINRRIWILFLIMVCLALMIAAPTAFAFKLVFTLAATWLAVMSCELCKDQHVKKSVAQVLYYAFAWWAVAISYGVGQVCGLFRFSRSIES